MSIIRGRPALRRLENKVAIVTGAAQGIGAEFAKALAAEGARVALCDLSVPEATIKEIERTGGTAFGTTCDVTNENSVKAFVAETTNAFDTIHILVNNAAIFSSLPLTPMTEITSADWDKVMTVNVRGSFECVRAVLPVMRSQKYGKIINIASGTVFRGVPLLLHYVSSKGAVVAMTRAMARELGDDGIRVNCLAPGLTLSEGVVANGDWTEVMVASNTSTRCIKREETPQDLVGAILFLASTDSDFMSGQTMVVDGGSVTH
jgi:NAD(P)-dependent dehydrogenase (short-subunit alcohol dehydrogenase family)